MKPILLATTLALAFLSLGCSKAIENASAKCHDSPRTYVGGNPQDNCDLCCRVALNSDDIEGKGTVTGVSCTCSKKK